MLVRCSKMNVGACLVDWVVYRSELVRTSYRAGWVERTLMREFWVISTSGSGSSRGVVFSCRVMLYYFGIGYRRFRERGQMGGRCSGVGR